MGFLHSKCPSCWDPIPCACGEQTERDAAVKSSRMEETNRLLQEQNALLHDIRDSIRGSKRKAGLKG